MLIDAEQLGYEQAGTRLALTSPVLDLFDRLEAEEGLTKVELARRLGKKPSLIGRWLNNPGNWTLDTIAALLAGMEATIRPAETTGRGICVEFVRRSDVGDTEKASLLPGRAAASPLLAQTLKPRLRASKSTGASAPASNRKTAHA